MASNNIVFEYIIFLYFVGIVVNVAAGDIFACGNDSVVGTCECTEKAGQATVNCASRGLREWPNGIPLNTFYLYMENNNIQQIDDDALMGLKKLLYVDLTSNGLYTLPKFPKSIGHIMASHNYIQDIPTVFNGLPRLFELKVDNNRISVLRNSTFKGSLSINSFNLCYNPLRMIDPFTFINLPSISTIRMRGNINLQEIHENAFAFHEDGDQVYVTLILDSNPNLTQLSTGSLKNIPSSSVLIFKSCNLQSIPARTFEGSTVYSITFDYNNISFIHQDAFIGLKGLQILTLVDNNLHYLPTAVCTLSGLTYLDLSWNYLNNVEGCHLNSVIDILINKNRIQHLSKRSFAGMTSVQSVMLTHNNIRSIENGTFENTRITSLFLFDNGITNIDYGTLYVKHGTLQHIFLFNNEVEEIEENALQHMAKNSSVYIDCDWLRTLPSTIGDGIKTYCVREGSNMRIDNTDVQISQTIGITTGLKCNLETKTCSPCKEGTYQLFEKGDGICYQCPPGGFYQDKQGVIEKGDYTFSCKKCPNGTFSNNAGASSVADCQTCPYGTKTNETAELNACHCLYHFHRTDRYGKCLPCSNGLICNNGYQTLKEGYWWSWNFANKNCEPYDHVEQPCKVAYDKYIEDLANNTFPIDNPNILKTAVYKGPLPAVHPCPLGKKSCIGGGSDNTCKDGYSGWLCAVCGEGYYELFNGCSKCESTITILFVLLIIVIATVMIIFCIMWRNSDSLLTHLKIAINFYQILGILSEVKDIHWTENVESLPEILQYLDVIRYINIVSPRCLFTNWNGYSSFYIALATPLAVVLFVILSYFILYIKNKCRRIITENRVREKFLFILMMLLYLTYANTCADILAVGPWSRRTFYVTADGKVKKDYLTTDYSIDLDDDQTYQRAKILVYVALIYIVGFPVAIVLILRRYMKVHGCDQERNQDEARMPGIGFFCKQYKPKYWYWELFELYNKSLLALITNFKDDVSASMTYSLFLTFIFIMLHLYCEPLKEKSEQRFQLLALVLIIVSLSIGAIVDMDITDTEDKTVQTMHKITVYILLLLDLLILLFVIVHLLRKVCDIIHELRSNDQQMKLIVNVDDNKKSDEHEEVLLQET